MKRPEDALQRSVVHYLDLLVNQRKLFYFAIPNGGKRSKIEAAIMKGLGVKAGVPDLWIGFSQGRGIFIELKAPNGRVSKKQTEVMVKLEALGHETFVCRSLDEVQHVIAGYTGMEIAA